MIYQWLIIGAGPGGIAALGKLLDSGISPQEIAWIDPEFRVGDFGTLWRNVPSNTKVALFTKFLHSVEAFDYKNCPHDFALNHANPVETCPLSLMADALQWVSDHLKEKVKSLQDKASRITWENFVWTVKLSDQSLRAKKIILAIGSDPKHLPLPNLPIVPLHYALDHQRINDYINSDDTIAVFGSSHSAILVLRNLLENNAMRVINFYRSPLLYAIYHEDKILHDDTGLKGTTANWARENIDCNLPANLTRVTLSDATLQEFLPLCTKAIYAVGFTRRATLHIENIEPLTLDEKNGILGPGLFGIGIAFPELKYVPPNAPERRVGLWKFMDYLNRVVPVWIAHTTS